MILINILKKGDNKLKIKDIILFSVAIGFFSHIIIEGYYSKKRIKNFIEQQNIINQIIVNMNELTSIQENILEQFIEIKKDKKGIGYRRIEE